MRDRVGFDDGVRLTETIRVRVPPDFRNRMQAAAKVEGVAPTEFARRAIAERISRSGLDIRLACTRIEILSREPGAAR